MISSGSSTQEGNAQSSRVGGEREGEGKGSSAWVASANSIDSMARAALISTGREIISMVAGVVIVVVLVAVG